MVINEHLLGLRTNVINSFNFLIDNYFIHNKLSDFVPAIIDSIHSLLNNSSIDNVLPDLIPHKIYTIYLFVNDLSIDFRNKIRSCGTYHCIGALHCILCFYIPCFCIRYNWIHCCIHCCRRDSRCCCCDNCCRWIRLDIWCTFWFRHLMLIIALLWRMTSLLFGALTRRIVSFLWKLEWASLGMSWLWNERWLRPFCWRIGFGSQRLACCWWICFGRCQLRLSLWRWENDKIFVVIQLILLLKVILITPLGSLRKLGRKMFGFRIAIFAVPATAMFFSHSSKFRQ